MPTALRAALPLLLLTLLGLPWLLATPPSHPLTAAPAQATSTADPPSGTSKSRSGPPTATITPTLTITATVTITATPDTSLTPTPETPTPDTTGTPEYLLHLPLIDRARETVRYEWVSVTSPTTNTLNSISMVSTNDGWAVGDNGTIIHWDGRAWSNVPSPTTQTLHSVSMVSATDGWAVGDDRTILRWDGRVWTLYPYAEIWRNHLDYWAQFPVNYLAIKMLSPTHGWTGASYADPGCYRNCTAYIILLHWDGQTWTPTANSCAADFGLCPTVRAIAFSSPTHGWIVGNGSPFLRWDGRGWIARTIPNASGQYYSIDMVSATDAWAVGTYAIHRWNGESWTRVNVNIRFPYAIDMISANDGWMSGETLLHWDGQSWLYSFTPPAYSRDIEMLTTTEGWIVGDGGMILSLSRRSVSWP